MRMILAIVLMFFMISFNVVFAYRFPDSDPTPTPKPITCVEYPRISWSCSSPGKSPKSGRSTVEVYGLLYSHDKSRYSHDRSRCNAMPGGKRSALIKFKQKLEQKQCSGYKNIIVSFMK